MARAPNIEMGVVVGFSEVFDRAPTVEGAQAILAQYNRDSVLVVLAKLSAALRLWFGPDYAKDNGLACDVFLNAARVLRQTLKGRPSRLFFTRLGVLATARLALTACDEDGSRIEQPGQAAHVQACCLMMNELTGSPEPFTGVADLVVHQLPNHNAMPHYDIRADLLRSLDIFERNQELLGKQASLVDLRKEFMQATGLAPRQFVELCLVVGAPYRAITAASLVSDDPSFYADKNRFSNVAITENTLAAFFSTIARTTQELVALLPAQGPRPLADTTIFQSWPIIREPNADRYYCLDIAGLMEKTGRGLYWTLFANADRAAKTKLGGTYGRAFEAYLHERTWAVGIAGDHYIPNPAFTNGDEMCDAIFVDGSCLVICEYKSSVLRADAKLSGRRDQLVPEIDKKFVTGDDDGKKGIAQLSHGIARLLDGEQIAGVPARKWSQILPVMICLEGAMLCPGMSRYLNSRFNRTVLKGLSRTKIGPLILMDVEHFEDLLPDIKIYGFAALVDDYYRANVRMTNGQHDQLVPFQRKNIPVLDDKDERSDDKEGAFRRFFAEMGTRLFGEVG